MASQERSRATVDAMLRAAARILIRHGYDALTTNRVAADAGVSVGSLYQYFPNKEALVGALLDEHLERALGLLRAEAPRLMTRPLEPAVRGFVEAMLAVHRVEPELHRVFAEQLPRVGRFAHVESTTAEGIAMARAYLDAHRAELGIDDMEMGAFIVVHIIEALTHAAAIERPELLQRPELIDEITGAVVRYLEGSGARVRSAPR